MKKLLAIVVLGLLWSNASFAQSLKPLKNYIDENASTINDPVVVSYIFKRCGAVYTFASAVSKDAQADTFAKLSNEALLIAGEILLKKLQWSGYEVSENLKTEVTKMVIYYKEDGQDFFSRTGLYMKNNYIGDDLFICKEMMQKFRIKL